MVQEYDVVIKGGRVIDGTGNPWFKADIGIRDGKIVEVKKRVETSRAREVIDVEGLVVTPGFIDIHSHSDFSIHFNSKLESSIRQGVTTLVVGNCGMSLAPVNPENKELLLRYLSPFLPPTVKFEIKWSSFHEYLEYLEKLKLSSNIAHLVGHGTVRIAVMGFKDRAPTGSELEEMKELVAEAMEAGAYGLSTGLIYPPGVYSETREIIELVKVVARYGGIYASHIRGEGGTVIEAVKEAIKVGEECKVPVEISHHKVVGRPQWGKSVETLRLMEEARSRGVEVTCDLYPYTAGMTSLVTLLPPWVHEGGLDKLLERLRDPKVREEIKRDIERGIPGWENFIASCGWENIYVSSVKTEENKCLEGKNLVEIAKLKGKPDEFTALCDLLLEEGGEATMILFMMSEEDVRRIMKSRLSMVGSDSWSVAPYGVLGVGKPHPRFYGTYPRVLKKYVKEEKLLTLEEAVRKMTSLPAQKLGITDRGLIREGLWADIVVFDPEKVGDKATYQNPHQYPEGIEYVLVNGVVVVEHGEHTGALPGKILRSTR